MPKPKPIRTLFALLLSLFVLAFFLFAWQSWRTVLSDIKNELHYTGQLLIQSTTAALIHQETTLRLLGKRLLEVGAYEHPEKGRAIIEEAHLIDKGVAGFGFARTDGQLLLISGINADRPLPNLLEQESSRLSFQKALGVNGVALGRPYYLDILEQWCIPIEVRIPASKEHPAAVMIAGQKITGAQNIWANLSLPPHTGIAIVRDDGYPQFLSPLRDDVSKCYTLPYEPHILQRISFKEEPQGFFYTKEERSGKTVLVHYDKLPQYGLTAMVMIPLSHMLGHWFAHFLFGLVTLAVFTIFAWIAYQIIYRAQKAQDAHLIQLAHYDQLTKLPNRTLLLKKLEKILKKQQKGGNRVAVLFVDLDYFKKVNDSFGHHIGDKLLSKVAQRFQNVLDSSATLARQGGDEFIVLLPKIGESAHAQEVAQRLLRSLAAPIMVKEKEIHTSASIGIALSPDHGQSAKDLLRYADTALYKTKEQGRNRFAVFNEELNYEVKRRREIEGQLHKALERGEFSLRYQPIIQSATGAPAALEVLIRWQSPQLGFVPPDEFIPIAEDMGLVDAIDLFVLNRACRDVKELTVESGESIRLSVNLSAKGLYRPTIADDIMNILDELDFDPRRLTLEITETAILEDFDRASEQLRSLRQRAIGIALDDFGTGYSSLSHLHRLPVTEIKIDRSFTRNIFKSEYDSTLVRSIIQMGKGLGMRVVAEGVESQDQYRALVEEACDYIQGFVIARPMPIGEAAGLIRHFT